MRHLPYDYARCAHEDCSLAGKCLRALSPGRPGYQVYAVFAGDDCPDLIDATPRQTKDIPMTPTRAALAAFFALAAILAGPVSPPVLAASAADAIAVPWGAWLSTFLDPLQQILAALLLAAATAVVAMLPAWIQEIVRPLVLTWRTDQLFDRAAAAAIAGVRGVAADRTLTITTTNDLVRTVLQIAVERGAPVVLDFAGRSARSLAEKALARLHAHGAAIPAEYSLSDATAEASKVLRANPAQAI